MQSHNKHKPGHGRKLIGDWQQELPTTTVSMEGENRIGTSAGARMGVFRAAAAAAAAARRAALFEKYQTSGRPSEGWTQAGISRTSGFPCLPNELRTVDAASTEALLDFPKSLRDT